MDVYPSNNTIITFFDIIIMTTNNANPLKALIVDDNKSV